MSFRKRFPKDVPTQVQPKWVEVQLSPEEESTVEQETRKRHAALYKQCVADAKSIVKSAEVHADPAELVRVANALFDKRASHVVWHKEAFAKEKLDESSS